MKLSDLEPYVREAIAERPEVIGQCGISAFSHLDKARALLGIDNEMAAFRAITAEEEAATALMHSMVRHRYPGAEKFKHRDHSHKVGLVAIVHAAVAMFSGFFNHDEAPFSKLAIYPKTVNGGRGLALALGLPGTGLAAHPTPPLHAVFQPRKSSDRNKFIADGLVDHFRYQGAKEARGHLRTLANQRNQLLYAGPRGLPAISTADASTLVREKDSSTFWIAIVILLSDPWKERAGILQQCIEVHNSLLANALDFIDDDAENAAE